MPCLSKFALALTLVAFLSGCRSEIVIDKYQFTVSGLYDDTARELERDFARAGYDVRPISVEKTLGLPGQPVLMKKYSISGPGFTTGDLKRITRLIENKNRGDRLLLQATTAAQAYESLSVDGTAYVEVWIDVPKGSEVYLRRDFGSSDARAILLQKTIGRDLRYFSYRRRAGEEYVDIVIVKKADPNAKGIERRPGPPDQYVRISLSYPFKAQARPWKPPRRSFGKRGLWPFGRRDKSFK